MSLQLPGSTLRWTKSHTLFLQASSPPHWPPCCNAALDQQAQAVQSLPFRSINSKWEISLQTWEREGIVGRAAESSLGLNHMYKNREAAEKIPPYPCSWANPGGFASSPAQSVENGFKIKDSNSHIVFFVMAFTTRAGFYTGWTHHTHRNCAPKEPGRFPFDVKPRHWAQTPQLCRSSVLPLATGISWDR